MAHPDSPTLSEFALYQEPFWYPGEGGFVKSLLLFFDGVALLTPEVLRQAGQPWKADPTLAEPLADQGLLTILDPSELIDGSIVMALAELLEEVLAAVPATDSLEGSTELLSRELLFGRVTGKPALQLAAALGRAGYVAGDVTAHPNKVTIDSALRAFVLSSLGQLVRAPAESLGYSLQPLGVAGPHSAFAAELLRLLDNASLPSRGRIVVSDLEQVAFDLSTVPLHEVLEFRDAHGADYRRYVRDLRSLVRTLSGLGGAERQRAFEDRREALADAATELRKRARTEWRRPMASFALGVAGAGVTLSTGNPAPAVLSFASALLGLRRQADPSTAYTYLFSAANEWPPTWK